MNEKVEAVSVLGKYTLVEIFQLDEDGERKPGSQFAVMVNGSMCFGPCERFKEAKGWAIAAHESDTKAAAAEALPNEAAAESDSISTTTRDTSSTPS